MCHKVKDERERETTTRGASVWIVRNRVKSDSRMAYVWENSLMFPLLLCFFDEFLRGSEVSESRCHHNVSLFGFHFYGDLSRLLFGREESRLYVHCILSFLFSFCVRVWWSFARQQFFFSHFTYFETGWEGNKNRCFLFLCSTRCRCFCGMIMCMVWGRMATMILMMMCSFLCVFHDSSPHKELFTCPSFISLPAKI